jgi:hypothetical protein
LISIALYYFAACQQDESNSTPINHEVLGIESITINDVVIHIDNNGKPIKEDNVFSIVGFGFGTNTYIRKYDLVIWNITTPEKNFRVGSKFNDTHTEIVKSAEEEEYRITFSRTGFNEVLVYKIGFMKKS